MELHNRIDHIKPASWRGDVNVDHVSLQTSWNEGRRKVEESYEFTKDLLGTLDGKSGYSMLAPHGSLLFDIPEDNDDNSLDVTEAANHHEVASADVGQQRVEVEDAMLEEVHGKVLIGGTNVSKSRALSRYSKYRLSTTPNSTDRLRRVQGVSRYTKGTADEDDDILQLSDSKLHDNNSPDVVDVLSVSDPIASLLSCEASMWLCVGEVNGLRVDGKAVEYVNFDTLAEETVTVSYQLLGLRPATTDEDPSLANNWRTYQMPKEKSFTVPGAIVTPINPDISTTHTSLPWYLLESKVLVSLAASLSQSALLSPSTAKKIPVIARGNSFPYLEQSGEFVCSA